MNKMSILKALLMAAAIFPAVCLISCPVYYFALAWQDGMYAFYIEFCYIAALAGIGFFGAKRFGRIFGDDGSGDVYLLASLILMAVILAAFRASDTYAVGLAEFLYPDGARHWPELSLGEGFSVKVLKDLLKFSSVCICTYVSSFCMIFSMFFRVRCMEPLLSRIKKLLRQMRSGEKENGYRWSLRTENEERAERESAAVFSERTEEEIRKELRERLFEELGGRASGGRAEEKENPPVRRRVSRSFPYRKSKTG